jgi:aminoglycoside 3-N-acetyltransferase
MTGPLGVDGLALELARLLPAGRDVLVHSSLRRIGRLDGGPGTLLAALRRVIGTDGTVVVPAQTPDNSTTSPAFRWAVQGFDTAERAAYVARMPGFDRASTPSFGVGTFAEHVRTAPEAVRSAHPQTSFAAVGPRAMALTATHDLGSHLGGRSPLAALYRRDAMVLLLGVGYEACTAFHLAEYGNLNAPVRNYHCFVADGGLRREQVFPAVDLNDHDFTELGAAFEQGNPVTVGRVGQTTARAFPIRTAVDFAIRWMAEHRWS